MLQIFLSALSSFCFSFIIVYFLIHFLGKNKVDLKDTTRPFHRNFIPELGGLGFGYALFFNLVIYGSVAQLEGLTFILAALILIFAVGVGDDHLHFKARVKFVGTFIIAGAFVYLTGFRISSFHGFLGFELLPDWFSYGFAVFILLALTHGFNLADGIDGLAATLALIALTFLGSWFYLINQPTYALFSFTLIGGVLAFLKFNWFPAKIFMGDTGSLTLGFSIGILLLVFFSMNESLPNAHPAKITASFSMGLMLVAYPVLDTLRVMFRRLLKKQNPFKADGSHIHHILLNSSLSHGEATKLICFTQLFFILVTFQFSTLEDNLLIPAVVFLGICLTAGIEIHLAKKRALKAKLEQEVQLES